MELNYFDVVVVGSGPAGQRAAVQAAKAGAKTAIIDRRPKVGGVCLHAGTIPSKTLREAVLYLRGIRQRHFYGEMYRPQENVTLEELYLRVDRVLTDETQVMESQLRRNGVTLFNGQASFENNRVLAIVGQDQGLVGRLYGDKIIIATGTVPRRPGGIPFDQEVVFDSNFIFSSRNQRTTLPKSLAVLGAGVIGTEYATMFATLGCKVWLIDRRASLCRFLDDELHQHLVQAIAATGVELILGAGFGPVIREPDGMGQVVISGRPSVRAEAVLHAMGRCPTTEPLCLENTEIKTDAQGLIPVNERLQTAEPHIYAAGDVIGFPALASTSSEQGRMAARHALGLAVESQPELFPFAIYAIPELSYVGRTERQLAEARIATVSGIALYQEIAKAAMIGDPTGFLKLLVERETRKLLGVHIIGDLASELVHIGLMTMRLGGTIDALVDSVFNYPTLAEAYKVAALNAVNRLAQ
jgi:NAD(P) transhydrogenase